MPPNGPRSLGWQVMCAACAQDGQTLEYRADGGVLKAGVAVINKERPSESGIRCKCKLPGCDGFFTPSGWEAHAGRATRRCAGKTVIVSILCYSTPACSV